MSTNVIDFLFKPNARSWSRAHDPDGGGASDGVDDTENDGQAFASNTADASVVPLGPKRLPLQPIWPIRLSPPPPPSIPPPISRRALGRLQRSESSLDQLRHSSSCTSEDLSEQFALSFRECASFSSGWPPSEESDAGMADEMARMQDQMSEVVYYNTLAMRNATDVVDIYPMELTEPHQYAKRWKSVVEEDAGFFGGERACAKPIGECVNCDNVHVDEILFRRLKSGYYLYKLCFDYEKYGECKFQGHCRFMHCPDDLKYKIVSAPSDFGGCVPTTSASSSLHP